LALKIICDHRSRVENASPDFDETEFAPKAFVPNGARLYMKESGGLANVQKRLDRNLGQRALRAF
jgi:hypothetical protein